MGKVFVMAVKDLRILWTDKVSLFFVLAFPLIISLLTGTVYGGMGSGDNLSLSVVFIDFDDTETSADFVEKLSADEYIKAYTRSDLAKDGDVPDDEAVELARKYVRKGSVDCFLVLPQGFEKSLDRFWEGGGELRMGIDPTKQAQSGILRGLIMRTWFELMHQRFMDVERSRELVSDGIEQLEQSEELGWMEKGVLLTFLRSLDDMLGNVSDEEGFAQGAQGGGFNGPEIVTQDVSRDSVGPRSAFEVTFPSGILWAMIACVSAFAVSTVRERTHGTLLRLNVAPVTHSHFLAGKALAAFIACTVVTLMLLAISQLPAFGVRFDEPGKVALAVICNSLCFVGITMLVSTLGKTEQAVGGLSWGVLLIMAMFGGGMIPLFIMPDWLLVLSDFSPVKWGITAFEGAIWRDYSYAELALPCGILLAVGVVGFLVGVFRLSKQGRA